MSQPIQNLAINNLLLKGYGNEYNGFSRLFKSVEEANKAVEENDYTPVDGKINAVIVLGKGIMLYSFELQTFIIITEFMSASNQANKFINLDGVNDYINFASIDESINALDFTKDWSIGLTFVGITGGSSAVNMTLFSRKGVHITLKAQEGSTNWGLYVTSDNSLYSADKRAQANTWYRPNQFDRILFTYNSSTKRLKYFIGDQSTGSYAQRANLLISDTMIANQNIDQTLSIGNKWTGEGGVSFSGVNLHAGVDNLIVSNVEFTGPHLTEYFQTASNFEEMELYNDLISYSKFGEDNYPNILDKKGKLQNGVLVDGTKDDFKDIPTE